MWLSALPPLTSPSIGSLADGLRLSLSRCRSHSSRKSVTSSISGASFFPSDRTGYSCRLFFIRLTSVFASLRFNHSPVKLLALNLMVLLLVLAPLLLLEILQSRMKWLEKNHDWLSIVVWIVTLLAIYIFVLPRFGLAPNPQMMERF